MGNQNTGFALEAFKTVLSGISEKSERQGIVVRPFGLETDWQNQPSGIDMKAVAESMQEYFEIIPEVPGATRKELDLRHLTAFLNRQGLRILDSRFKERILDGDLIEAYRLDGTQIFRNLEFFRYCSYTLWELIIHPWFDLYDRPSMVLKKLMAESERLFATGESPMKLDVPLHILREKSGGRNECEIDFKYAWPLYGADGVTPKALILTVRAKIVKAANTFFI